MSERVGGFVLHRDRHHKDLGWGSSDVPREDKVPDCSQTKPLRSFQDGAEAHVGDPVDVDRRYGASEIELDIYSLRRKYFEKCT